MKLDVLRFLNLQRQIFGICPRSGGFFRLSDCRIFRRQKPTPDWLDALTKSSERLDATEEQLEGIEEDLREAAREKGRRQAANAIRRIDPIFGPRRLDPDDAKVLFHPVDYVVFNGMNRAPAMKSIILLDRERNGASRSVQKSLQTTVQRRRYEWQTIRVLPDGAIKIELD